jgi:photosystem II stability/assembly factor-like uncharacterized protein
MIFAVAAAANAQWQKQAVDTKASLRGLSVVNEKVVWASGSGGTFLRTVDGGKNWTIGKVPDADKLDFRDVEAFDANTAYLLSIGEGENSRIYKTIDGGATWKLQFKNSNPKAFFDAIAFWDRNNGMAMSDPVDGKYLLLKTTDGGINWKISDNEKMANAKSGEAAFAASGTCLVAAGKKNIFLVSGGMDARVFRSGSRGLSWFVSDTPIVKGTPGSGIFSIAMLNERQGVIVGGNYEKPEEINNNAAFTNDGGVTWTLGKGLSGYRSGVTYVDKNTLLAVGASGSDLSTDGGKTWKNLDRENYNAVQAKGKRAIWAVGANGLVAKFQFSKQSIVNANLRSRVLLYLSNFEKAQYDKMWEMSSKKLREGNDNDKQEFVRYAQKHNLPKIKTNLVSLDVNNNSAEAVAEMSLWIAEENRWVIEMHREFWVFENGDWFFDTYKVVDNNQLK